MQVCSGNHADADLAEHLEVGGDGEPVDEALVACVQLGLPLRAVGPSPCAAPPASPMLVRGFGMQLHAAVTVDGRDRKRLERVCRYLLRPPFALDAVQRTPDGQVRVHFKKPNRFGATFAQMSADTFLARLCALVPPPRAHTVLYYGVLSAHHKLRSAIVPRADEPEPPPKQLSLFTPRGQLEFPAITTLLHAQLRDAAPSRLPWMTLLARVFRVDISVCSRCCGPMRVIRAVTTPQEIAAELRGARPPPHSCCSRHRPQPPESRSTSASLRAPRSSRRACELDSVRLGPLSQRVFSLNGLALAGSASLYTPLLLPGAPRRSLRHLMPPAVLLHPGFFPLHFA